MKVQLKADNRPGQTITADHIGIATIGTGTVSVEAQGDGSTITIQNLPGGGTRTDIRNGDGTSVTVLHNPAAGNGSSSTTVHTDDGQGNTTTTTTTTDSSGNVTTTVTTTP
jgi:hypothetical protein